jgi:hypothetical protein
MKINKISYPICPFSFSLPFLTETIPSTSAKRYTTLVFTLLGYSLSFCGRRMPCCRGIVTCFLAWQAGIVGPCGTTIVHAGASGRECLDFKGLVGCYLLALLLELGFALSFDMLLGEVVCATTGCQGNNLLAERIGKGRAIHLPTHEEGAPSKPKDDVSN